MIGQTVGHYKILDRLGAGGMGEVYRAEDSVLKRQVALKVLPPEVAGSQERLKRFRREAELVASLNHPNIVVIYSVEEAESIHFLTMELIEGQPLHRVIPADGLAIQEYFDIAVPLADALSAAHEQGIVHRDLKPDNIMVSDRGVVKVLDFGLAKPLGPAEDIDSTNLATETLTSQGKIQGTVPYMSPEQVRGREIDHQSDIFSLGIVLHEMATGRRLFHGESSADTVTAILTKDPDSVAEVRPDLPFHLSRIISHCLVKNQAHRYQSTGDLRDELVGLKREVESGRIRTGTLPRQRSGSSSPRKSRRFAIAALCVALALVAFFFLQRIEVARTSGYETVAVMPFENMTGDPSQDYLSDGLASGLISSLTEVSGLRVVSKSEAWSRQAEGLAPTSLARALEVQALIEGELRRSEDDFAATVTLTDGQTGYVLWTDRFLGGDVGSIGQDIAARVTGVLSISLTPRERNRLAKDPTNSLRAYDYYLQGEQFLAEVSTPRNEDMAADLFRQAIQLDESFSLAHVGLSEAFWRKYQRDKDPKFLLSAERQATVALGLDPDLPAAVVALARVHRSTGRYALSIADLRQTLARHPRPDQALRELAVGYEQAGDLESAEESLRGAVEIRGDFWQNWHSLGSFLMRNGRYEEARDAFSRAAVIAPATITWPQENLATIMILEDDAAGAIELFEELGSSTQDPFLADNMATAYFFLNRLDEAEALYKLAVRLSPQEPRFHGNLGDLYQRQGRSALAESEYRKAFELAEQVAQVSPQNTELRLSQSIYAAKAARCDRAREIASSLEIDMPQTAYNNHDLALVYALCNRPIEAIAALDRAVKQGFSLEYIQTEDEFHSLSTEPGFQALTESGAPK